jgi:hypothetical protein
MGPLLGAKLLTIETVTGRFVNVILSYKQPCLMEWSMVAPGWVENNYGDVVGCRWERLRGSPALHGGHGASMAAMSGQDRCHKIMSMCSICVRVGTNEYV